MAHVKKILAGIVSTPAYSYGAGYDYRAEAPAILKGLATDFCLGTNVGGNAKVGLYDFSGNSIWLDNSSLAVSSGNNLVPISGYPAIEIGQTYYLLGKGSAAGVVGHDGSASLTCARQAVVYATGLPSSMSGSWTGLSSVPLFAIYGHAAPVIVSVDGDDNILDNQTGVDLVCTDAMDAQGTGKLYLSNSATFADPKVEQTINTWGDSGINFDVVSTGLTPGTIYGYILTDLGQVSATFSLTLTASTNPNTTTYRSIVESGGSDIAYVWHVLGYPWAVCNDPRLVDLANVSISGDDARYIREKIFGTNTIGELTPAHTARIIPTLISVGPQTTKAKTPGVIDVGSWSIEIQDRQIGGTYEYADASDEIWGLDGLHRTPNLSNGVHGWGFLAKNFSTTDGAIHIADESQSLYDRIDAVTTFRPLWMGHECIAVTGISAGSYPNYSATVGSRGLYKSKKQHHFTYPLDGLSQKIADVPGSVAGHFCELYEIPITNSGGFYYDKNYNPVIAMTREGTVSTDVGTVGDITSVKVLGPFEGMKTQVDYSITDSVNAHFKKYIFCRGASGTDWNDIYSKGQKPHLVVIEYNAIRQDGDYRGYWTSKPIWLCDKDSYIVFDTIEDVVDAVNTELEACHPSSDNYASQHSGDNTALNNRVTLDWDYSVTKSVIASKGNATDGWEAVSVTTSPMWYLDQSSGGGDKSLLSVVDGGLYEEGVKFIFGKWSQVGGVVQMVLGLGVPHYPEENLLMRTLNQSDNSSIDCFQNRHNKNNVTRITGRSNEYEATNSRRGAGSLTSATTVDAQGEMYYGDILYDRDFWSPGYTDRENEYMKTVYYQVGDPANPGIIPLPRPAPLGWTVPAGLCRRSEVEDLDAPDDYFVATYFVQWGWISNTVTNEYASSSSSRDPVRTGGVLKLLYPSALGSYGLYLDERLVTEQFPSGTEVRAGQYTATLYNFSTSDGSNYMILSDDLTTENKNGCAVGSCLVCVPAYCVDPGSEPIPENVNSSWDENEDDPYTVTLNRSQIVGTSGVSDVIKAFLGHSGTGVFIPFHEQKLWIPFFRTDGDHVSQIDWDNLEQLTPQHNQVSMVSIPLKSFSLYDALDHELKLYGLVMCEDWDETHSQVIYRFRPFGNVVSSETLMRGRVVPSNYLMSGVVPEDLNDVPMFNRFTINYTLHNSTEEMTVNIKNPDTFSLIQRDVLNLDIKPLLTHFTLDPVSLGTGRFLEPRMVPILIRTSQIRPMQKRKCIWSLRFKSSPGREILITDPAAHYPQTHAIGLESAAALVTEQKVDTLTGTVEISYLVSGSNSVNGYAPACRANVADVSLNVDGFTVVPEDFYGSSVYGWKDIFFFDSFNMQDPDTPTIRTSDNDDYAVLVYAQDDPISADNPIPGTCEVFDDSGTWKLRVYCDESKLPATGKIIIVYGKYDDCESEQKPWLFFSDEVGSVGTVKRQGDTWR